MADADAPAGRGAFRGQPVTILDARGEWFLDENVAAVAQGIEGHRGVAGGWGQDVYHVNAGTEQGLERWVGRDTEPGGRGAGPRLYEIGDSRDADLG